MTKPATEFQDESDKFIDYRCLPEWVSHLLGIGRVEGTHLCAKVMEPLHQTPKLFVAMEFISKNPSISQKSIVDNIGTAGAVRAGILDTLRECKLLKRVRSPRDRRAVLDDAHVDRPEANKTP